MEYSSLANQLYSNEFNLRDLKNYVADKISEIYSKRYNLSKYELKNYLLKIPIYIKNLGNAFNGIILGRYKGATDYKNIYSLIEISPIALLNPALFERVLAEEFSHAIQAYLGIVKKLPQYLRNLFKIPRNRGEYENHPLEKEAKEVANGYVQKYSPFYKFKNWIYKLFK